MQMLGYSITDYAEEGLLGDLGSVATKEGWFKVVPAPLQKFSRYEGHWVAAPIDIHRTNWIWANKKIFDALKITPPKTFEQLLVSAEVIKKAGITSRWPMGVSPGRTQRSSRAPYCRRRPIFTRRL